MFANEKSNDTHFSEPLQFARTRSPLKLSSSSRLKFSFTKLRREQAFYVVFHRAFFPDGPETEHARCADLMLKCTYTSCICHVLFCPPLAVDPVEDGGAPQ